MKRFAPPVLGALGGFAYYYFIGCSNGTCPISGNPWASATYGALMGVVLTIGKSKEDSQKEEV